MYYYALDSNNKLIALLSNFDWVIKSIYSGSTIEELTKEYWPLNILDDKDKAFDLIDQAESKIYNVWIWYETTKEKFYEMLEILPPEDYKRKNWNEIFSMSEYLASNITTHFAFYNNKYYKWNFRTSYNNILDLLIKIDESKI